MTEAINSTVISTFYQSGRDISALPAGTRPVSSLDELVAVVAGTVLFINHRLVNRSEQMCEVVKVDSISPVRYHKSTPEGEGYIINPENGFVQVTKGHCLRYVIRGSTVNIDRDYQFESPYRARWKHRIPINQNMVDTGEVFVLG